MDYEMRILRTEQNAEEAVAALHRLQRETERQAAEWSSERERLQEEIKDLQQKSAAELSQKHAEIDDLNAVLKRLRLELLELQGKIAEVSRERDEAIAQIQRDSANSLVAKEVVDSLPLCVIIRVFIYICMFLIRHFLSFLSFSLSLSLSNSHKHAFRIRT